MVDATRIELVTQKKLGCQCAPEDDEYDPTVNLASASLQRQARATEHD
jgi:hypothetical protein